eukprot:scaffold32182_cov48-Attheya_sp.AAC.5
MKIQYIAPVRVFVGPTNGLICSAGPRTSIGRSARRIGFLRHRRPTRAPTRHTYPTTLQVLISTGTGRHHGRFSMADMADGAWH